MPEELKIGDILPNPHFSGDPRQLAGKLDVDPRWLETGKATVRFCATARVVSDKKIELKVPGQGVDMLDELSAAGFDVKKFIRGPLIVTISKA